MICRRIFSSSSRCSNINDKHDDHDFENEYDPFVIGLLQGHCTVFTEQECQMYSGSSTLNLSFYQSAVMPMTIILVMRYFT